MQTKEPDGNGKSLSAASVMAQKKAPSLSRKGLNRTPSL